MSDGHLWRPHVTLKLATSLDGRIATATGASKWITGPQSRAVVHQMRANHECVLTGIGTVLADDCELTARTTPPQHAQPLRAVLDSDVRIPLTSKLLTSAGQGKIVVFHGTGRSLATPQHEHQSITRCIVDRSTAPEAGLDLKDVLKILMDNYSIASVMVEAGAKLASAFLRAGYVDELVWFRAPILIGGDGLAAISSLSVSDLTEALALKCVKIERHGPDTMEVYVLQNPQ